MFVKYQFFSIENGHGVERVCVLKTDSLIAKKIPDDGEEWGIYLLDVGEPIAIFANRDYAMCAVDRFCSAINSGSRCFDLKKCEDELTYMDAEPIK